MGQALGLILFILLFIALDYIMILLFAERLSPLWMIGLLFVAPTVGLGAAVWLIPRSRKT